jgi:S1-C subfamily serine protease
MGAETMSDLKSGIVSIKRSGGEPQGAGFVVTDKTGRHLIVTCSHVVQKCEHQDKGKIPDAIEVKFLVNGKVRPAHVVQKYWLNCREGDVAVLSLKGSLPAEAQALPLGSSEGTENHEVSCFGFPELEVEALIGSGKVIGKTKDDYGQQILQLESQSITLGFSGAPLWDPRRGRVIGMVSDIAKPEKNNNAAEGYSLWDSY